MTAAVAEATIATGVCQDCQWMSHRPGLQRDDALRHQLVTGHGVRVVTTVTQTWPAPAQAVIP